MDHYQSEAERRQEIRESIAMGISGCCGNPNCDEQRIFNEELAKMGKKPDPSGTLKALLKGKGDGRANTFNGMPSDLAELFLDRQGFGGKSRQPDLRDLLDAMLGGEAELKDDDDLHGGISKREVEEILKAFAESDELMDALKMAVIAALEIAEERRHERALTTRFWRNVLKPTLVFAANAILFVISIVINIVKEPYAFIVAFRGWYKIEIALAEAVEQMVAISDLTGKRLSRAQARSKVFKRVTPCAKLGLRLGRWWTDEMTDLPSYVWLTLREYSSRFQSALARFRK